MFARKIVCDLKPGQDVGRGEKFGMIKLGSRTELILPDEPGLEIVDRASATRCSAGSDVLAKFCELDCDRCESLRLRATAN